MWIWRMKKNGMGKMEDVTAYKKLTPMCELNNFKFKNLI